MSERIKWITYKDKKILLQDFSNLSGDEFISIIKEAKESQLKEEINSIAVISIITDVKFSKKVIVALNDFIATTNDYSYIDAIVGLDKFKSILYDSVAKISNMNVKNCDSVEEAKEWIANQ